MAPSAPRPSAHKPGLTRPLCLLPTAEACVEPQITPSYYTTSDAVISTETVFIVELSVTCKNRVQVRHGRPARRRPGWKESRAARARSSVSILSCRREQGTVMPG